MVLLALSFAQATFAKTNFALIVFAVAMTLNLACWALLHGFLRRLPAPWRRPLRLALAAFFLFEIAGFCWISLPRFLWHEAAPLPGRFLPSLLYLWNLLTLPLLSAGVLVVALVRFAAKKGAKLWRKARSLPEPQPADPGRRAFLARGGAAILPAVSTLGMTVAAYLQLPHFRTRRLDVPIADLPPELDGLKIAHLSDFHLGRFAGIDYLNRVVDASNALDPDLVVFAGDLIDFDIADLPAGLDILRRVRSRYGLWICEGNHDLYDDPEAFHEEARRSGLNFLFDESRVTEIRGVPVEIIGLRWQMNHESLKPIPWRADAFPILLAHHPHHFDAAALSGIPLTLSGHTHGGQLMLTDHVGCGPAFFRYWSGLYEKDEAKLVVSNGAGNWFPLRINAPAEIGLLTLRRI